MGRAGTRLAYLELYAEDGSMKTLLRFCDRFQESFLDNESGLFLPFKALCRRDSQSRNPAAPGTMLQAFDRSGLINWGERLRRPLQCLPSLLSLIEWGIPGN